MRKGSTVGWCSQRDWNSGIGLEALVAILVTMASREAHRELVQDTLRRLSHEKQAAFMASALTRAGRFYREDLASDDNARSVLDSTIETIWQKAVSGGEIDPSVISAVARLWTGEDEDARFAYQDEFLSALDSFFGFIHDRRFDDLLQTLSRLLDLWTEAAYDQAAIAEYTRANDEIAWGTSIVERERLEQLEDLRTLATSNVDLGLLNSLRSRAQSVP